MSDDEVMSELRQALDRIAEEEELGEAAEGFIVLTMTY